MECFTVEERQLTGFIIVSAKSSILSYERDGKEDTKFFLTIMEFSPRHDLNNSLAPNLYKVYYANNAFYTL